MKTRVVVISRVSRVWIHLAQMAETSRLTANEKPNPWGISTAGTPEGLETPRQTAQRELKEEIGKLLPEERFIEVGTVHLVAQNVLLIVFVVEFGQHDRPTEIKHNEEYLKTAWCHTKKLPWDDMLPEHPEWIPDMLHAADNNKVLHKKIDLKIKKKPAA